MRHVLEQEQRSCRRFIRWFSSVGFPESSVGKGSACNAEDPSSILGSGRSTGDGIGYPLQYSWASLVAQLVKNLTARWETWVRSPGWEVVWRRERLPTPVFWPGEFHGQRSLTGYMELPVRTWWLTCKYKDLSNQGRSPGEGNDNPLQYSGLENSMERGAS